MSSYYGVVVRDHCEAADKFIIDEVRLSYKAYRPSPDDRVLDIGAHIGSFQTLYCGGVADVLGFEPNPDAHAALAVNSRWPNMLAGITRDGGPRQWYLRPGSWDNMGSTVPHLGRVPVYDVSTQPFMEVVQDFRPTVIKIDSEGAEYEYLGQIPEAGARVVIIELPLYRKAWRATAVDFVEKMSRDHTVLSSGRLDTRARNATFVFERGSSS